MAEPTFDGWALGWRTRIEGNYESAKLLLSDNVLSGAIDPARGDIVYNSADQETSQASMELLTDSASAKQNLIVDLEFSGDDRLGKKITYELPHLPVRGLSWVDTSRGKALSESGLPIVGPLFLLAEESI